MQKSNNFKPLPPGQGGLKLSSSGIRQLAENVKHTTSPLAFFEAELGDFKGSGIWRGGVDCPFCNGKKDKFHIHVSDGGWRCSKCGAAGGDIISFVQQRYNLKFLDAIEKIAGGVDIQPDPEIIRRREAERLAESRKQGEGYAQAAQEATRELRQAKEITEASEHHYLVKKRVRPHGARVLDSALIVPLYDASGKLSTIQRIYPDGTKRLLAGGKKTGCFYVIGEVTDTILIAEGFATAASLHEQTGKMAVMAVDAGNLLPVSQIFRARYPGARIFICSDNDAPNDNPALDRIGQRKARAAALAIGAKVSIPPALGDWNDYYNSLEVVV